MLQMTCENFESILALVRDLQVLINEGVVLSNFAYEQIDIMNTDGTLYYLTFGGTYVCVVAYLLFSYAKSRKSGSA